jgi:hypothetical protein
VTTNGDAQPTRIGEPEAGRVRGGRHRPRIGRAVVSRVRRRAHRLRKLHRTGFTGPGIAPNRRLTSCWRAYPTALPVGQPSHQERTPPAMGRPHPPKTKPPRPAPDPGDPDRQPGSAPRDPLRSRTTRWQLSVTTAKPNPIRRERLDHCLAGRPPHPQASPKPTDPARHRQVRALPPRWCPDRQVVAAATVPDAACLSVEPGPGADYYLSLGTRPHPTPGVGQPARCWGRHRRGPRTPTRVRGQAIRCPGRRRGVRTPARPGCGAAIGGGFGH